MLTQGCSANSIKDGCISNVKNNTTESNARLVRRNAIYL